MSTLYEQQHPDDLDRGRPRSSSSRMAWLAGTVALAAGLAVGGIGGYVLGTASGDERANASERVADRANGRLVQAQEAARRARTDADVAEAAALQQLEPAKAELAKQEAAVTQREAALKRDAARLAQREKAVEGREKAVTGAEQQAAANSIPGDGTFLVGQDVQPGTYRASPPFPRRMCYVARLADPGGEDIIDNDISEGPVIVQVRSTDAAVTTSGCSTFRKVG